MSRRKRKKHEQSSKKSPFILITIFLLVAFASYHYAKTAIILLQKERINAVVYGKQTYVYSFGLQEGGNYVVPYYPDLKVEVPGGYGQYRVGALGKLVSLEKKPDILTKTFSLATSTFVDYYLYTKSQTVYFGGPDEKKFTYPNITDLFLESSNASLGEKLALAYLFLKTPPQQFSLVPTVESDKGGERQLLTENFYEQYQGYFYQKTYRNEKKDVQILYTNSYESAGKISKILQGNGIRVSDLSQVNSDEKQCRVKESGKDYSKTAQIISKFFNCELVHGKTDIYDIVMELGNKEREW